MIRFKLAAGAALAALVLSSPGLANDGSARLVSIGPGSAQVSFNGAPPTHMSIGSRVGTIRFLGSANIRGVATATFTIAGDPKHYWIPAGQIISKDNAVEPSKIGNTSPEPAKPIQVAQGGLAPDQPPGYFCPAGWFPNPGQAPGKDGSFRCYTNVAPAIPPGWSCPSGLVFQDHLSTGMLICKSGK